HHHGGNDSHRATVEHHLDQVMPSSGNASEGNAACVGDGAEHERRGLDVGMGMLHIDGQPWKAGACHEPRCCDTTEREPSADLRLPGLERPFDWIFFQVASSTKFPKKPDKTARYSSRTHETSLSSRIGPGKS